LAEMRTFLVGQTPGEFPQAVLDVLRPYEREKPIRTLMRQRFPSGPHGFVPEDLDVVLRHFGKKYGTDSQGRVRLVETKFNPNADRPVVLKGGQLMTFQLLDRMLRASTMAARYDGFFVVTHTHMEILEGRLWVQLLGSNRPAKELTADEFMLWLSGEVPANAKPSVGAA
jgi:hypothetical protein